jgi:hypothetical protein
MHMPRPAGVTAIAILCLMLAAYLCTVGFVMLASPGSVSMAAGAPLLGGLETAGPYMFLLVGAIGALIAWGLLRLHNWARRAAIIVGFVGMVLLIPSVSAAVVGIHTARLVWGGLGIIVRMVVLWYLWQLPVREAFGKL